MDTKDESPKAHGEFCSLHGEQYSIGCKGCEDAIATKNRIDALMPE